MPNLRLPLIFWLVRIPHVAPWSWTCDLCYDVEWKRESREIVIIKVKLRLETMSLVGYKLLVVVHQPWLDSRLWFVVSSGNDWDLMSTDRYCWDTNWNVANTHDDQLWWLVTCWQASQVRWGGGNIQSHSHWPQMKGASMIVLYRYMLYMTWRIW